MNRGRLAGLVAAAVIIGPPSGARLVAVRGSPAPVPAVSRDTLTGRRLRPEIVAVIVRGAHAVSPSVIERSITTTASHCRGILLAPFCLISKAPYFFQRFYLSHDELKRDVLRIRVLYWMRGYRLASVDTTVAPPGGTTVRVTFTVHEGPPTRIRSLVVTPDTVFLRRVVARLVRVHVGGPLDLRRLDTGVARLEQRLWARGYADASVDTALRIQGQPPSDSASRAAAASGRITAGTADVKITLIPRPRTLIDTVLVSGNQRVSAQTIRHAIVLRPRSLFLRSDIERSQRGLFQTNLFRNATVRVDTIAGKPDSLKQALVSVVEGPWREGNVGAGFTTVDFFSLSSRFDDYNWVGGARHLVVSASLGNLLAHGLYSTFNNGYKEIPSDISPNPYLSPTWTVSSDVTQPWFLGAENSLALGVFAHRRIAPGVFIDNGYGGNITFAHDVAERAPLSLTYRYEETHVDAGDVYFCVDYGVCDAATRGAIASHARLSPLTLGLRLDRSNDPLNPSSGFQARADVQYASQYTASDFRYDRAYLYATLYRPIGTAVLAFNARAGVVHTIGNSRTAASDTVLHPTVRFYAGGAQSVRGFGENQLGPRVLTIPADKLRGAQNQCPPTVAIQNCPVNAAYLSDADFTPQPIGGRTLLEGSVEYRFPIHKDFGGALFVDAAVVGEGDLPSATSGTSAVTPGFGFRYYSILGPIRVDIGLNPLTTYRLVVLTENANRQIVVVSGSAGAAERVYSPARTLGGLQGLLNRFSLHLSIGQAY